MKLLKNCRGFTLLELLIVMTIFSAAAAVTVPNYLVYYHNQRLEAQAHQLMSDIRYFQNLARAQESKLYNISFDINDNCYRVLNGTEVIKKVKLYSDVQLVHTEFDLNRLMIGAAGNVVTGGTVTLASTYTKKLKYVIVASVVGRVRVSDTLPEDGY